MERWVRYERWELYDRWFGEAIILYILNKKGLQVSREFLDPEYSLQYYNCTLIGVTVLAYSILSREEISDIGDPIWTRVNSLRPRRREREIFEEIVNLFYRTFHSDGLQNTFILMAIVCYLCELCVRTEQPHLIDHAVDGMECIMASAMGRGFHVLLLNFQSYCIRLNAELQELINRQ